MKSEGFYVLNHNRLSYIGQKSGRKSHESCTGLSHIPEGGEIRRILAQFLIVAGFLDSYFFVKMGSLDHRSALLDFSLSFLYIKVYPRKPNAFNKTICSSLSIFGANRKYLWLNNIIESMKFRCTDTETKIHHNRCNEH